MDTVIIIIIIIFIVILLVGAGVLIWWFVFRHTGSTGPTGPTNLTPNNNNGNTGPAGPVSLTPGNGNTGPVSPTSPCNPPILSLISAESGQMSSGFGIVATYVNPGFVDIQSFRFEVSNDNFNTIYTSVIPSNPTIGNPTCAAGSSCEIGTLINLFTPTLPMSVVTNGGYLRISTVQSCGTGTPSNAFPIDSSGI